MDLSYIQVLASTRLDDGIGTHVAWDTVEGQSTGQWAVGTSVQAEILS